MLYNYPICKNLKIVPIKWKKSAQKFFYSYNLKYIQNNIFTAVKTFKNSEL